MLRFKFEARTSRESMREKVTYFVTLHDPHGSRKAIGECALFRGLSADDIPDYEELLTYYCSNPEEALTCPYSSIRMGFETAFRNFFKDEDGFLKNARDWLDGERGIKINGLIWMGDKPTMLSRVKEKIDAGFSVLKLKIGGIKFDEECDILRAIRSEFSERDLILRLDANGSFSNENAMERLDALSKFGIHSIEQPIRAGQWDESARICRESPIPIALDEELIGCREKSECELLLDSIMPQYIILKPSLCGGFSGSDLWIELAEKRGIGWWATSALESNIGLKAIAEWVADKRVATAQGLGTGQLYTNNIPSSLELRGEYLFNHGN